ncbi:universal stress protein [Ligilactobacillus ceti]|uniref:Universal stress protein n=1 Tax=Ligilactobacillus ceti DSM 22408 TaxID=1122146 RepID=A0A0R2KGG2_9LACO|nr:universal stress protein [Ligilactobacillus ceti]KRN88496.1 universal stress protein [Ligilactobacillus ceti DSM 22408]
MQQQYKNILVPVDGSDGAEKALVKGVEIAKRNKAHLDVVTVIDLKQFSVSFAGMMDANGEVVYQAYEDVDNYLDSLLEKIHEMGLEDVKMHARFGSPRTIIAHDLTKEYGTDLIVMGPTGLNAVERMFVGSVTDYVIRAAPCDVIIGR